MKHQFNEEYDGFGTKLSAKENDVSTCPSHFSN